MGKISVSKLLVKTLEQAGVRNIYGITGDSANHITDEIAKSDSLRFIHVRHEESAGMAAAAEALATNKLAVCMGSCGPGSLHLLNGLYEAQRNGTPVLAIVTEIHRSQIGTQFIQEIDTQSLFKSCSHFCQYVRSGDSFARLLGIAMQTAIARGGVAVLIMTAEVSIEQVEEQVEYLPIYTKPIIRPSDDELRALATELNEAENVLIFAGSGSNGAPNQVKALSSKLSAPLMWTCRSAQSMDYDNPYPIGMAGILGTSASDYALHNCDVVLLLGCGFAFGQIYPENIKIIQVDINAENLGRRHALHMGLCGDIAPTIDALLPLVRQKDEDTFANSCVERYRTALAHLFNLSRQSSDSIHKIRPEALTEAINLSASNDALITADIGTPWAFMSRYMESHGKRQFFASSLHGTMAAAIPTAIGLCLAEPDRQVVALCGDGGVQMLMGELVTLKQEGLKPKIFIYNNSSLNFVAMEMKADGLLDSYTYLQNPNFAQLANSIGLRGISVQHPSELESAIDDAMSYDGAVVVDVVVDERVMLVPPKVTATMVGKYSHYVAKMIRDGHTEEAMAEVMTAIRSL